ncbi:hypothetical protein F5B17DRAFT_429190 [Nemania serpens]|nr:hypothetical protein F5B17DRAFT_429190 [Nemania serpens]
MKPVVGAMQAWSCVVISVFAILILSVIGSLYRTKHHEFVGSIGDPENTTEVSNTIFTAVIVYAVCFWAKDTILISWFSSCSREVRWLTSECFPQAFLVCCGLQGVLHLRENRRGAIAL